MIFKKQAIRITVVLLILFCCNVSVRGAESEYRSLFKLQYYPVIHDADIVGLYVKVEERFRSGDRVYSKQVYGLPVRIVNGLSVMVFYANKYLMENEKQKKSIYGFDVNMKAVTKMFLLKDRIRTEYHETDSFNRFRNAVEAGIKIPYVTMLSLFTGYEFRYDSDQERINVNDILWGIRIKPSQYISFRLYYDDEFNRRNKSYWERTNAFGFQVSVAL
ncbi:MAG TPA: hypothetical protein PK544_11965 [Spirochaetota bacterium]|nr:hypothetical protein [Spirochaetota bacterium]HPQ54207.1 hypothetical protein [Spirochaetota bacterium]